MEPTKKLVRWIGLAPGPQKRQVLWTNLHAPVELKPESKVPLLQLFFLEVPTKIKRTGNPFRWARASTP